MRTAKCAAAVLIPLLSIACGSDPDPSGRSVSDFNPPPPEEGFTRLTAKRIHDIQPNTDVTYCQYLMAPFDRDMDVVKVGGYQSKFGHHAVAFSYVDDGSQEIGASTQCMGTEFNIGDGLAEQGSASSLGGTFLGGIGGEGAEAQGLPEGVAFRLKAGQGIVLNLHYINTGRTPIDGDAVVDIKFGEVDPNRKIAALFLNLNAGFNLSPRVRTDSSIDCVAQSDVAILMMANHMHEYGVSAKTEVVRAGTGAIEVLHDDPQWAYEMQFNPEYSTWPVDNPFILRAGDTIRTSCHWTNSTADSITFPREMCIGVGFALATGNNPIAPACFQGFWFSGFGG